jgi:hypothetical protein
MPGSGASLADVSAVFAMCGVAAGAGGADGREQPANIVSEIAANRNPAAAVPGLKIEGIRKGRTSTIVRRRAATRSG